MPCKTYLGLQIQCSENYFKQSCKNLLKRSVHDYSLTKGELKSPPISLTKTKNWLKVKQILLVCRFSANATKIDNFTIKWLNYRYN